MNQSVSIETEFTGLFVLKIFRNSLKIYLFLLENRGNLTKKLTKYSKDNQLLNFGIKLAI
jgi:hypothetical protein